MPTIQLLSTPREFGEASIPQGPQFGKKFSLLRERGAMENTSIGGRFSLPKEFDSQRFASSFHAEGNEAQAMTTPQPVMGTKYEAEGWEIWKYPVGSNQEGKPHRVPSLDKGGQTYVLMCRSIEVQAQVNEAYGQLSRANMVAEARGETVGGDDPNSEENRGMLSTKQLDKVEGAILEADREFEERMGKETVVHSTLPSNAERLKSKPKKLSR